MNKAKDILKRYEALKDGTKPDGTGPHGRGEGPGKGRQVCNIKPTKKVKQRKK